MERTDSAEATERPTRDGGVPESGAPDVPGLDAPDVPKSDASSVPGADVPGRPWMLRDDEFLLDEDREYVVREERRSWLSFVPPVVFGALVALMVADAALIAVAVAAGVEPLALLPAEVAAFGFRGLLVAKAGIAVLLVTLPGLVRAGRSTRLVADATDALVGLSAFVATLATVVALT
ncbi:hypothetical protein [Halorussus amylolyticus]|uniref:hypothetical protein n=1 Tax=Halorussus amylolyticus TaxID=1126242 RepID=UPI00104E471B|nr:hypothetical protein [Halorussus amylolyticus]